MGGRSGRRVLREEGHEPVVPPVLVREEALFGTGFLPGDREQIYELPKDDLFLVGTAEVPLASIHADDIFEADQLPVRYAGFSMASGSITRLKKAVAEEKARTKMHDRCLGIITLSHWSILSDHKTKKKFFCYFTFSSHILSGMPFKDGCPPDFGTEN